LPICSAARLASPLFPNPFSRSTGLAERGRLIQSTNQHPDGEASLSALQLGEAEAKTSGVRVITFALQNFPPRSFKEPAIMKTILSMLIGCVFAFAAHAQTPSPTPSPSGDDVVKITTTLVQVDATVTDKKGNVVRGLNPDDFEIYVNGERQKITNFSFVEPPTKTAADGQPKVSSKAEKVPTLPTKLAPEQVHRTVALVVDDLGLSFSAINPVKESLRKFVDEQMQFGDLVAIVRTGNGTSFLEQFTSDKRILYAAIDKIHWNSSGSGKTDFFPRVDPSDLPIGATDTPESTSPEAKAMLTDSKAAAEAFLREQREFEDEVFNVGSLGAIKELVGSMGKLPGRKAIVLFSEGFKLYTQDIYQRKNGIKQASTRIFDALQTLTDQANRNGVVIYPVDARGVVNGLMINAEDNFEDLVQTGSSAIQTTGIERSAELLESQQGLRVLAEDTGGVAVINNNDLNMGIAKALGDQAGYYLIGYQPEAETFDPKNIRFNKIEIKVTRPDLRVRYHHGFYGVNYADTSRRPKSEREQIYGALTSPLAMNELNLQLASVFANDAKTGNFVRTMIYIDGPSLSFKDEGDGWQTARYDVVAVLFGEKDSVIGEISRKQAIKANASVLKEIKEKGFVATVLLPVKKPGAYQMRVVVRDEASSKIGSASEFVKVPNINKDKLFISGLLLQRADDPGSNSGQRPFQTDAERDLALRTFRPGTKLRIGLGIYNAKTDSTAKSVDISVRYRVFKDGVEVYHSPEKRITAADQSDPRRIIAEDDFRLGDKAQQGNYILQMIVRDKLAKDSDDGLTYQFTNFDVVQ
jgi:VWFA-related protein